MAYKKKSPANYGVESVARGLKALGSMIPTFSAKKYMEAAPGEKFKAATSSGTSMPKTSGPKKLSPGGGVRKPTITNEGLKIPGVKSDDRPAYERPGTGSTKVDKPKTKTVKPSSNTNTSTKTKPAAKPITSSDSGDRSGGYLKNTKNFSLGVDLSMPKSKMQTTVTNARSANTDLISGRMSRRDKIAARQSRKTARVRERVGNQIERIKSRQERAGIRAGAKMARRDKGINVGKMESQRKLDAFESPRATPRTSGAGNISSGSKPGQLRMPATNVTGQKAAQDSMKLKPTMSKTQTLSDSQLNKKLKKKAVKKKNTGKTKSLSMTRGEMTKNLTQLAMK